MISLLAPFWLMLLLFIPVIRWLHRFQQLNTTFITSTLFLFKQAQHHQGPSGKLAKPDPQWLLRALIFSLIVLSLTEPMVKNTQALTVEVWLDNSLSMFTREADQKSRMELAMRQLHDYLIELNASRILLHPLGNPGLSLNLQPDEKSSWIDQFNKWTSKPGAEPFIPAAATLSLLNHHVLITDGADIELNSWALSAPLQHILKVGKNTQNLALTRLSLRKPLLESSPIEGITRISNLTETPQQALLILQQEGKVIETQTLKIPASSEKLTTFVLPKRSKGQIEARIDTKGDALPWDNQLQLKLDDLEPSTRYIKRGQCSPYLDAFLISQPGLVESQGQADLIIDCSYKPEESNLPRLKFHSSPSINITRQTGHWHNFLTLEPLRMVPGLPYAANAPALNSAIIPILSADDRILIQQRPGSPDLIESYLNVHDPALTRQPEFPLIMLGLISRLTGKTLSISPLMASRDFKASRITPQPISSPSPTATQLKTTKSSLTESILLITVLLLLVDTLLTFGLLNRIWKPKA